MTVTCVAENYNHIMLWCLKHICRLNNEILNKTRTESYHIFHSQSKVIKKWFNWLSTQVNSIEV